MNHDGEINYSEFLAVVVNKREALTKSNLEFAFHFYDVDHSGTITADDLHEAFQRQGKKISKEEIVETINQCDMSHKGEINF